MKSLRAVVKIIVVFFCSGFFLLAGSTAGAGIHVRLPLPRLFLPVPPPLVLIPGTYAYVAPDVDADIIFYQGSWYRPHDGYWYVSGEYNGPWRALSAERVPRALVGLPPNFRRVPPGHERMPYGQVKNNWKTWEHERHWDDHGNKNRKNRKHDDHGRRGHDRGREENGHRDRD